MFYLIGFFLLFLHFFFFLLLLLFDRGYGLLFSFNLFDFIGIVFRMVFVFDWVSFSFVSFVSLISSSIFFYSKYYMGVSSLEKRFAFLLFGFVLSIFFLVFGGNMFLVILGWDGLGLISFCLVVFYQRYYSLDSGLVTVYSNRVGDVFFLFCFSYFLLVGDFRYVSLSFSSSLICLFFFIGCIVKRAQIPFSAWLPAAIAAPTPVSSLVHSSTLVTAGVYVLIRFNSIFFFLKWVIFISCLTIVLSGYVSCLEKDLKKVIAISTLSQLSVIIFSLSIGLWKLAFLHVILHALYKSLLFLGCGSLMLSLSGGQDSRFFGNRFGGIRKICFYTSALSLVGFPFAVGFFSKDVILLTGSFLDMNLVCVIFFFFGCLLTVFYSIRLIYYGFLLENFFNTINFNVETVNFGVYVSFLWTWASLSGFVFSWFCVSDLIISVRTVDVLSGVYLLRSGLVLFLLGVFSFMVIFRFFYLRILSRLNLRVSSGFYRKIYLGDYSWLEFLGPRGVYRFVSNGGFLGISVDWMIFRGLFIFRTFFLIFI